MREIILLNGRWVRCKWFQIHSINAAASPYGFILKSNWYSVLEWQGMRGEYHDVDITEPVVSERKSGRWIIEMYSVDDTERP